MIDRMDVMVGRVEQPPTGAAGRDLGPQARPARLSPEVRSTFADAAAIATLRADLDILEAELHDLAASMYEMRRHEHVEAFLDGRGDPVHHRRSAERHRALAVAERASAETARSSAERKRQEAARHRIRL